MKLWDLSVDKFWIHEVWICCLCVWTASKYPKRTLINQQQKKTFLSKKNGNNRIKFYFCSLWRESWLLLKFRKIDLLLHILKKFVRTLGGIINYHMYRAQNYVTRRRIGFLKNTFWFICSHHRSQKTIDIMIRDLIKTFELRDQMTFMSLFKIIKYLSRWLIIK